MKAVDFILPSLIVGGAEKMTILLAEQFRNDGWEVRFVIRRKQESMYHEVVGREFALVDLEADRVRSFPTALYKFYQRHRPPDLVIASLWPLTFLTTTVLRALRAPTQVITIEHGSLKYRVANKRALYRSFLINSLRWTMRLGSKVVAVSEGLRDEIATLTAYSGPNLVAIPNPIEISEPREGSEAAARATALARQLKGPVLLSVGRLKKVKNLPLLLRGFARLLSATDRATLLIVGDGVEMNRLKELSQTLGISDHVHFLGFIEDCAPYYTMADIFTLTSDSEGFGNVIVEALMAGCTVVSTDCDYGPREILKDQEYGYLVPVGDELALAKALQMAISHPVPPDKSTSRGEDFTPHNIYRQYQRLIQPE